MDLTDEQIERYARHIVLKEVGGSGQARLLNARVLVVGAGGLGSPITMYLAAAGVGTIGIIDFDDVSLSNLQRQILHTTKKVGTPKVNSAKATLLEINPGIHVEVHSSRLTATNAMDLISRYHIVADGSDNFATRFLVNDACKLTEVTLVSGALSQFDGQVSTFKPHAGPAHPCYRCIYGQPPPGPTASCSEAGILGALVGMVGSLQAVEVLKEIIDIGESLSGQLIIYDSLHTNWRKVKVRRDPECPLCGDAPTITDLSAHKK